MKKIFASILSLLLISSSLATEIVSPHAPGGPSGAVSMLLENQLGSDYKTIYKPGATSQLAIRYVSESFDSMLVFASVQTFVSTGIMQEDVRNIVDNDLEVIGTMAIMPTILFCNSKTGIKNMEDLINYKGRLLFGTTGIGTGDSYNTQMLIKMLSNKDHAIVPYAKGGAKPISDLLGNHINCMFAQYAIHNSKIKNENLNAIVVSNPVKENLPVWKDLNMKYPDLITNILGVAVSKKMPLETKTKIKRDLSVIFATEEFKNKIINLGFIPLINDTDLSVVDKVNKETANYLKSLGFKF